MVTGLEWAKPFLDKLGVCGKQWAPDSLVEFVGSAPLPSAERQVPIVVVKRPEAKPEDVLVGQVVEAFCGFAQ